MENKILVAYFSASGITARAAQEIATAVNGDVYEIRPRQVYTQCDLDWTDTKSRSSIEMADLDCRPQINGNVDLSGYNVIFIGFPVWWYVEPRIIDTFLETNNFSGKTVIPFATSGGSGISGAQKRMKQLCPAASWVDGRLVNHGAGEWAKKIVKGLF